jgi:beta,beta-carotene 9',10'-dioxygenase
MRKVFNLGFGQTTDELVIEKLPVRGRVPNWMTGSLIRNGPGTFQVGEQRYRHWFDGLAMLHLFSFQEGQVSYANKFLRCKAYNEAMETAKISYSEFATDPCYSIFERVKNVFSPNLTDSAKVNIGKIGERFLALGETPMQIEFDPKTLDSIGVFNYDKRPAQHVTTVHPHFDAHTNQTFQITTRFGRISRYRILEVKDHRSPRLISSYPVKEPAYMHSFGMSPHYFILTEFPFVVYPLNILFSGRPFIENFKWKPQKGTPFYIFERESGKLLKKIEVDPFFAFHHVNSFESKGTLYIDLVAYQDADIIQAFYLNRISEESAPLPGGEFRRYRINLNQQNEITYETFSTQNLELPRFDIQRYHMREDYRYVYGVSINQEHPFSFYNQLVKIDLKKKESKIWYQQGCFPGEPIFLGEPGRKMEDDGVVLSVVLDEEKGNSFLLVLDASTFEESARAEIPHPVLFGYHGEYFEN